MQTKILLFSPEGPGALCDVAAEGMRPRFHGPDQPKKNTTPFTPVLEMRFVIADGTPRVSFTSLHVGESCEGLGVGAQEGAREWGTGFWGLLQQVKYSCREQCIKHNKMHPLPSLTRTLIIVGSGVLHEYTIMGLTRWFEVTEG